MLERFPDPRALGWRTTLDVCRELDLTTGQARHLVLTGVVTPLRLCGAAWWSPEAVERAREVLRQRAERPVRRGRPRTMATP